MMARRNRPVPADRVGRSASQPTGLAAYRAILRRGQVRRLMVSGLVARLREGGIGLALILLAHHATGSYAIAGGVSATFYLCSAVMRPVQGRWMDRIGNRQVLTTMAVLNCLLLCATTAAALERTGWLLAAVAAPAGASMPAVSATLRALWPAVVPDHQNSAFALDSLLYELAIVIGPVLAGLTSTAATPGLAVLLLAVIGLAGTLGVARASGARDARPQHQDRTRISPLTAAVRRLLAIAFFVGVAEGPLTVSLTAAATRDGLAAASGPLISAIAVGSVMGALVYGARSWTMQPPARLAAFTIMLAAALLALAAGAASIIALALAAIVVGLALAPAVTSIALGVSDTAPPQAITEAFAWISFATPCGGAAGQALAGTLAAGPGPRWGFIEAAAGASIAAVLAAAAWHGRATRPAGSLRCSRAASGAGR
jgi:MFS family permease